MQGQLLRVHNAINLHSIFLPPVYRLNSLKLNNLENIVKMAKITQNTNIILNKYGNSYNT